MLQKDFQFSRITRYRTPPKAGHLIWMAHALDILEQDLTVALRGAHYWDCLRKRALIAGVLRAPGSETVMSYDCCVRSSQ